MEIRTVVLKESAESLSLNLVSELVESVAIDEELFFWRVCVEVKVE